LDEDWFFANLNCGDRLIVRTLSNAPRDAPTTVQVRDSGGTNILASDTTGGGSSFSLLSFTIPSTGKYYVRVSSTLALGSYEIRPEVRTSNLPLSETVAQAKITGPPAGTQMDATVVTPQVSYNV